MLYINIYHVSQLYGGPEEGGWYYDAGEPVGSIPIRTKYEPGKRYYLSTETTGHDRKAKVTQVTINIRDCDQCHGTGQYQKESEESVPEGEEPQVYTVNCKYCGLLPEDLQATTKMIVDMYALFDDDGTSAGRYEHMSVSLQDHFATFYPDCKPHYE